MLSHSFNLTTSFPTPGLINIDVGLYDYIVVQIIGSTGTINFLTTNDGGGVQGETDGNATSAANFTAVQGTNVGSTSTSTSAGAGTSMYRFSYIGKYFQLSGAGVTATKIIVYAMAIG
jgi:hypothetical protein